MCLCPSFTNAQYTEVYKDLHGSRETGRLCEGMIAVVICSQNPKHAGGLICESDAEAFVLVSSPNGTCFSGWVMQSYVKRCDK